MQMLGRERPSWEEQEQPPYEVRAWPRQAQVQPQEQGPEPAPIQRGVSQQVLEV